MGYDPSILTNRPGAASLTGRPRPGRLARGLRSQGKQYCQAVTAWAGLNFGEVDIALGEFAQAVIHERAGDARRR